MNIAVLIPCLNEESSIANVINSFKTSLPTAAIYVYDNKSTDSTSQQAREAGAIVCFEANIGKGNVVKRMFDEIDAEIYVLADGDGQHDPFAAPEMIRTLTDQGVDMVIGSRTISHSQNKKNFRIGHYFANNFFSWLVNIYSENKVSDVLSGYKILTRRYAKSIYSIKASGFDIDTELTLYALKYRYSFSEYPVKFYKRAHKTKSKISIFRDSMAILRIIYSYRVNRK
jgi:glycosyltransferase involved in cell wall biosynthesis